MITHRSVTIYGRREIGPSEPLALFEWSAHEPERLRLSGVPRDVTEKESECILKEASRFEKVVEELRKELSE